MGFILDGLDTEDYDRQYSDGELLKRIGSYFAPHRNKMILVGVMITLNSLAGTGGPVLIAKSIDLIQEDATVATMAMLAIGVSLLGASAWGFNFIRQYFSASVIGNAVLQLRKDVFSATIEHDLSFYNEHPSGKIVSRITSDTQDFAAVADLTMNLISQLLLVIILTSWIFTISVPLTLIMIGMTPIAVAIALSFRKVAREVTQKARRVTAVINAQIQESISGIVVAKNFRQEYAIYDAFDANNNQAYSVGLRRGITLVSIFPIMTLASGFGTAVLLYYGGLATRPDTWIGEISLVSTGEWYLFMQAVRYFWFPMMGIASFWSQFQDGLSASERVFALIDMEPNVKQTGDGVVDGLNGRLQFQHINFSYNDKEIVLPDFSLDIAAGETIALVGHTGAGKSSIANLLTRFYEYQDGDILIDGRDVRSLNLGQYRQQIGLVPQAPFLFSGTVRDNIRYGKPNADDDAVRAAAMQIGQGEWLDALANGLDSDVGERGSQLSMGQRQLVALTRVLLADPAVFILDEATASIDPFTETQIQEGLDTIMENRTALVIAHRLSTVRHADRIIVLGDGDILEEGSHEGLLEGNGRYADLYNTYFRHQSWEYIEEMGRETANN